LQNIAKMQQFLIRLLDPENIMKFRIERNFGWSGGRNAYDTGREQPILAKSVYYSKI